MTSLKAKMILSYLAVALITVLVVAVLVRVNSNRSLMTLVIGEQTASLKAAVLNYYTTNGTLDGFYASYIQNIPGDNPPPRGGGLPDDQTNPDSTNSDDTTTQAESISSSNTETIFKGDGDHHLRGLDGVVDAEYRAIIPTMDYAIGETVPKDKIVQTVPVEVNGETIAYILPDTTYQFKLSSEEESYLERTTIAIALAALAGVVVSVLVGIFLASQLLKPIRLLTQASQSLAQGNLEQQVPVTSRDELGQLTHTFNQMSSDLLNADLQRKRLTADITHDLSTPLQIISGYIEMVEGGVPLTNERLEIIKTEIGHLRRLVNDLSLLSQVEGGGVDIQLQPIQANQVMDRIFQAYQPITAMQGVELTLDVPEESPLIMIDEGRMEQVLKNLVENAMRYTPRGGKITLSIKTGNSVQLIVGDNGQGIDPEDLPYVFDRFYQADKARGTNSGKMGLGLAICKALTSAQNGEIKAVSAGKGQGTNMIITFPPASAAR